MKNFTRNNSADPELKVGTYDGGAHIGRSYLHFNTAPIAGKVIHWGRLEITESHSWNCGAAAPTPYRVVQGWWGETMTGWPGAAYDIPAGGVLTPSSGTCPNRRFWADMNGASANWASGAWNNLGIALVAPNEGDNNLYKKFKSFETGDPPALRVGWTDPATVPSAPQNLVATARNLSASVSWAPPASNGGAAVDQYIVHAYSYPSGAYANAYAFPPCPTCTSATLTGLTNGQQYYFTVKAHNAVGWGPPGVSNVVVPAPQPPGPPGNPLATPRNLSATVSWTAPSDDGGAAIQAYGVFAYSYPSYTYLSYTQGCATCTSVSVPNLTNGQQYAFGIYAYNGVNWGAGVGTNVVTPAISTPSAPASVIASPGDSSATVAWSAPTDNGGAAITSSWVLAYTTSPSLAYANRYIEVCATCTAGSIAGLTNGVSYQFIALATNSVGNGAYTWSNIVTIGASPDLLAPTGVMSTPGDRQVAVSWTPPGLRLQGFTTYVARVFPEGAATAVASATVTDPTASATLSGLTNGQRYVATVTASTLLAINVESGPSAPFVTAGAPLAPPTVEAFPSDRKALVTWPATGSNGATITGYEIAVIDYVTQAQLGVTPASGSGTEVLGLRNGTQYQFKVRATNAQGTGPYSTPSAPITPAGRPFRSTAVTVAPGNGQATVTWEAPTTQADGTPGDNGAAITRYEIMTAPGGQSQTTGAQTTTATFTGLENGTEYVFMVSAVNSSGPSDPSYGTTVPAAPPATPLNVVASSRDASAYLQWDRSSPVGVAVTYTVVANPGGRTISTQSTSGVLDGLTNGQPYTFTVRATNAAGTSAVSSPSNSVTPQAIGVLPPPGPSCRTSTLPAPPAEVRVGDSIQRRIDVPCMPEYGRVRMGFFIADREVELFPSFIVIGRGDGRSFDPNMTPLQNRFYIEVDYTTGTGYVQVNKSCRSLDDSTCTRAQSLVNHFSSFQLAPDGTIILQFSIGDAAVGETPALGRVEVSGHLEIIPMNGNQVCFTGSASRYPSIELYHDRADGTTRTLAQVPQSQWGPIAMLGSDHAISGC